MSKTNGRRAPMKRRVERTCGERALAQIAEISLRLENGKTVRFKIDDELSVPADPEELHEAALNGHARFAFWAYQESRAHAALRRAERDLAYLEAQTYLAARTWLDSQRPRVNFVEGARVKAHVDHDDTVLERRKDVDSLREHWTLVASVRDAIEHRTHLLRKLLKQDQDANRG